MLIFSFLFAILSIIQCYAFILPKAYIPKDYQILDRINKRSVNSENQFSDPIEALTNSYPSLDYEHSASTGSSDTDQNVQGLSLDEPSEQDWNFLKQIFKDKESTKSNQNNQYFSSAQKRKQIVKLFVQLLRNATGDDRIKKVCWSMLTVDDFEGWPQGLSFDGPDRWNSSSMLTILKNAENIKLKSSFKYRWADINHRNSKQNVTSIKQRIENRMEIQDLMLNLLKEITGDYELTHVPWKRIKRDDFEWWPEGIDSLRPSYWPDKTLNLILNNWKKVEFKDSFVNRYYLEINPFGAKTIRSSTRNS